MINSAFSVSEHLLAKDLAYESSNITISLKFHWDILKYLVIKTINNAEIFFRNVFESHLTETQDKFYLNQVQFAKLVAYKQLLQLYSWNTHETIKWIIYLSDTNTLGFFQSLKSNQNKTGLKQLKLLGCLCTYKIAPKTD